MHLGHASVDLLAGALGFLVLRGLLQRMIDLLTGHAKQGQFFLGDRNLLLQGQEGLRLFDLGIGQAVLGLLERIVDLRITRSGWRSRWGIRPPPNITR